MRQRVAATAADQALLHRLLDSVKRPPATFTSAEDALKMENFNRSTDDAGSGPVDVKKSFWTRSSSYQNSINSSVSMHNYCHNQQNGKRRETVGRRIRIDPMGGDEMERSIVNDDAWFQGVYPETEPADVQRCLKNIVISQVNIIKKQQRMLVEKDREIIYLQQENKALKERLQTLRNQFNVETASIGVDTSSLQQIVVEPIINNASASTEAVPSQEPPKRKRGRKPGFKLRRTIHPPFDQPEDDTDQKLGTILSGLRSKRVQSQTNSSSSSSNALNGESRLRELESPPVLEVPTPGWRTVVYSTSSILEGTENITDEAFRKRHQKSEIEERRVIRRDRMRQKVELLRQKSIRAANTNDNNREHTTHGFTMDDSGICETIFEAIEVQEDLPFDATAAHLSDEAQHPTNRGRKRKRR